MAKDPRRGLHAVDKTPLIAIAGPDVLLGRELREVIEAKAIPVKLKLLVGDEAVGLKPAKVVMLTGSAFVRQATASGLPIVDVCGVMEDRPDARLRAPAIEGTQRESGALQIIAHPSAIALAIFLKRVHAVHPIDRAVLQIFVPASELGQPGIDELQQQTVSLLSFQKVKKDLYDQQLGFSLLSQYGPEAPNSLANIELKIDRHLATLLSMGGNVPMPSLRLIQAPVFHGYSFSIWIEFEQTPSVEALSAALSAEEEPPTNVSVAGHGEIAVGSILVDRNNPRACWFWMAADNLRIAAENAVEVLSELL